jgi:hypothetical protein
MACQQALGFIGSAFGLTRFLAAFLFGVNVRDLMAFTSRQPRYE